MTKADTNFQQKYIVKITTNLFDEGETVVLVEDDGTQMPFFRSLDYEKGERNRRGIDPAVDKCACSWGDLEEWN